MSANHIKAQHLAGSNLLEKLKSSEHHMNIAKYSVARTNGIVGSRNGAMKRYDPKIQRDAMKLKIAASHVVIGDSSLTNAYSRSSIGSHR